MSNEHGRITQGLSNMLSLFDEDTMNELLAEGQTAESAERGTTKEKLKTANLTQDNYGVTSPTLDEWECLYEAAIEFRELAPWNWLYEDQLFAVVNPEDGEVGYCSVMGAGGEFHAISVYRGDEGLQSYERIQRLGNAEDGMNRLSDPDEFLNRKSLMVSYEGSEDVNKRDRQVFTSLGLRFRGRQSWPVVRSYEPGCVPWSLTAKECRFLTRALEQALLVALRLKDNPNLLDEKPGCILTRNTVNGIEAIEWVDEWPAWPYFEDDMYDAFVYPSVEIDEMRVRRIMRNGKPSGAWEVDISYAPFQVKEDGRPYFPRLMLCVHHQSGMILSAHPAGLGAEASEFMEQFLITMEKNKIYPEQIVVKRQGVGQLLMLVAHVIGADLLVADFLPGIEMAREGMRKFMG